MFDSSRELNYQGTISFQRGSLMESLRISHAVRDGEEFERLEYMDGDNREIIRRGDNLSYIYRGDQFIRFYQQNNNVQSKSLDQRDVSEYYQFKVSGNDRVAGRLVVNVEISPKDTHRFGYRLSLDKDTGLLMRTELLGLQGKLLERFQFVEVTIGKEIPEAYFIDAEHSYDTHHGEPELDSAQPFVISGKSWRVGWLPGGFTSVVANFESAKADDMVTFTDGLSVFSVFIEREPNAAVLNSMSEGIAHQGATTAFTKPLLLAGHPHRVTVVGEIPAQTAQKIAQSIVLLTP
jgi:sigma-E factor negative regulatory protein RseB